MCAEPVCLGGPKATLPDSSLPQLRGINLPGVSGVIHIPEATTASSGHQPKLANPPSIPDN